MNADSSPENAPREPATSWHVHPAADRPRAALLALSIIAAISGLAWLGFGGPQWGLLAALVLLGSLRRFFFPSTYELDANGLCAITILGRRKLKWPDVREFRLDANGGFLSTTIRSRWFNRLRGQFVLFDDDRQKRIEQIRAHLRLADADRCNDSQRALSPDET